MKGRTFVVVGVVAMVLGSCLTVAAQQNVAPPETSTSPVEISGTYVFRGANPDRTTYHGVLHILKVGEIYQLWWRGSDETFGVGILVEGLLAVSVYDESRMAVGVVIYEFAGPTAPIVGKWTSGGDGKVYPEILTKVEVSDEPNPDPVPDINPSQEQGPEEPEPTNEEKPTRPSPKVPPGNMVA